MVADGYIPPDTNLAVGATQVVQIVNVDFAIYDKTTGSQITVPAAVHTIFAALGAPCGTQDGGDVIALYDHMAGRWLISQLEFNSNSTSNYVCVAVSTTSDATGSYNLYSIPFGSVFPDYPKWGIWPDGFYFSANMFQNGTSFIGAKACAFPRSAMLAGQTAAGICFQQSSSVDSLLPSNLDGSNPPSSGEPNFFLTLVSNGLNLYRFHADFVTPANSTFSGPFSVGGVAAFTEACAGGTCIPQPGTKQKLDSLGDRLMFRLTYRNFGSDESLVVNHSVRVSSSTNQTGIRWYEIRNPNGTPSVFQQSSYAPDTSAYRWLGSMAQDQNADMAVGYSVSNSSSIFPGIRYTGRLSTDALSTLESEATIVDGAASQTGSSSSRWGDYSGMSIDPSDDCTFWYTNEYIISGGSFNWNTRIASFKFPGCATIPPAPGGLTATPGNAQVALTWNASSGALSYNVYRSTSNGGPYSKITSVATTSDTDTALANGTAYYYVVTAVDSFGESPQSSQASATPVGPPPAPTGLAATAGNAQASLTWNTSSGASSYNVYRSTTNNGPYTKIIGVASTGYTNTGLTNGTAYYYVVTAVNSSGESGNSNQATATPLAPPLPPGGLTATPGNAQVALTWNTSSGASSYNVYRSTTNNGPYTKVTGVASTSYTNTGLTNGTTYYYVVTAVNSSGESGNSNQASAMPSGGSSSNGYTYSRAITIDHTKVPNTDQSNFPVLISGAYPYLATVANGGSVTSTSGFDILFTSDAAGTSPLSYQRETYNPSTGAVNFWVKLPTVSHTSDTVFYMFYGNSAVTTDQSNRAAVWDSGYSAVWHLSDNAANTAVQDSTANGNNGTAAANTSARSVSGEIGGALTFGGSDYVTTGLHKTTASTWEAWFYTAGSGGYQSMVTIDGANYLLMDLNGLSGSFWSADGLGGTNLGVTGLSPNSWNHLVLVRTGDNASGGYAAYLNGSLTGQTASGSLGSGNTITLGYRPDQPGQPWNGNLDEIRVSNIARSADWIAAEYNNQKNPSTFYSIGAGGGFSGLTITNLSPSSGSVTTLVTITGTGFGSARGTSTVSFNGTATTPTSWSPTTIQAPVPAGATSGNVVVAVSGTSSNGVNFTVTGSGSNGYTYSRAITIDHTKVPNTDQTNFPVLISGAYPYLATVANGGSVTSTSGFDILFTSDAAGTSPLSYQRETYNPSTGAVNFWVKLPTVSHTSDTVFYMFYGNSAVTTDQSNRAAVWDSGYSAVWHLSDNAANTAVQDSTANGNNGTAAANTSARSVSGEIGGALTFGGSDYVTTGLHKTAASTWEAWFYTAGSGGYQSLVTIDGANYLLMDLNGLSGSFWSADGLGGPTWA